MECARELWGVSFSEVPDKYYFALRQEHMVVEADAIMQGIMEKLQVYRNRLTILFEVSLPQTQSRVLPFVVSFYQCLKQFREGNHT